MSKTYLKIKIKSLAAEARIIRQEEKKWPGTSDVRTGLHLHRVNEVRREARVALLAYGFIRGRAYEAIEFNAAVEPDWSRVAVLASRYGSAKVTKETLMLWPKAKTVTKAAA